MTDYKLIVLGVELDLPPVSFPITKQISDLRQPDKRKLGQSKEVALPGSRVNLNFFSSVYQLSVTSLSDASITGIKFDPSQTAPAQYYENGEIIFDGLLQLVSITEIQGYYEFRVTLFSNFIDVFNQIKDITIADLGWSEYDHTLSRTNITNSWNTSVVVDGSPVTNFTAGVPDAFGYLYGLIDWGYATQLDIISTTDLVPMVYAREVFEKIFEFAGLTYSSTFLDSELYKRVVIGFEGGDKIGLGSTEIAARVGDLDTDFDYTSSIFHNWAQPVQPPIGSAYYRIHYSQYDYRTFGSGLLSNQTFNNGSYDALGANVVYTVPQKGTYKIQITGTLVADLDYSAAVSNPEVILNSASILIKRNGSVIDKYDFTVPLGVSTNMVLAIEKDFKFWNSDQITFELLTKVSVKHDQATASSIPTLDWTITDNASPIQIDITSADGVVTDGDTIQVARYLPEMKCSDFLRSQLQMFNLYFLEPVNGVVEIEPLNDFYTDTDDFDDWTQLLDHGKQKQIIPCSEMIQGKTYKFKWKEDKDYYNEYYRSKYLLNYGDHNYDVESAFQTGEVVYQIPFAQSIPVEYKSGYIVPRIVTIDQTTGSTTPFRGSPRIFCYNGLVTGSLQLYEDSVPTNITASSSYPQMNHLQDVTNADFDLNFGRPEVVYWTASAYTDQNLFKYHEKFLREVTGRDAKMFRAYFNLSKIEINQGFDRLVMINGVLFRKNKIKDYNNISRESCLVELIRVLEADDPANPGANIFVPPRDPGGERLPSPVRINDQYRGTRSSTSSENMSVEYSKYLVDTTSGDIALDLPTPEAFAGMTWTIKLVDDSNTLTIRTTGDSKIDGQDTFIFGAINDSYTFYCDGTNYYIIHEYQQFFS